MPKSRLSAAATNSTPPCSSPPPPPAAALVSAASAQGTSSSSFANNDKSLQSAISETCRADLSGESNVVGATPNSQALFRQFLDFLNSDSNSRSEFSVPSPAPAPRVLASAPPPTAFTVNPPTATLGCPAVGPTFRDSRPIQSLELADIPATLPYAGVHKSRGAREGRSQPPPHWSAPGGGSVLAPFGGTSIRPTSNFLDHTSHLRRPSSVLPPSFGFSDDSFSDTGSFSVPEESQFVDRDETPTSMAFVAAEARALLLKYQGDLYESTQTGALDPEQGGRPSASFSDWGLFVDAAPRSVSGIALPEEFVSAFRALDVPNIDKGISRSVKRAFAFSDEDEQLFFSDKSFAPDTIAFATSLRDPSASCPLRSKDFASADRALASVAEASTLAARCAAYSTALADLLVQADVLEVVEDDRRTIRDLLVRINARTFSESLRAQLRATHFRRLAAFKALNLPTEFNSSAVTRVPRDGPYVFGGQLIPAVDSDISMNTRAREVARRVRPRPSFRSLSARGGPASSSHSSGSFRFRSRGRGFSRRSTSRGRGSARPASTVSAAPGAPGSTSHKK